MKNALDIIFQLAGRMGFNEATKDICMTALNVYYYDGNLRSPTPIVCPFCGKHYVAASPAPAHRELIEMEH